MFSNMYFYLMVVVLVFAVGDMIGHFTKGKLSGMMMVMLLFLIAFLAGILPGDIISQAGLTQLAQALRAAMPEKKLYVAADAPVSGQTAPDYTALGQAADELVLRVAAYTDTAAEVPVYAMEPLEHICYALGVLTDQVPAGKLSLLLTAAGQAKKSGGKFTAADAKILETLTGQGTAYYSDRYACAYVETKDTVAWYLDGRALTARRQLLNCFGVSSLCVSTLNGTLSVS